MSKKDEHKTKKLLGSVNLDKPSANFTSKIMSEVHLLAKKEVPSDIQLTVLLQKHDLDSPSANFTSNLMGKISGVAEVGYQPLISKKMWRIIGVLLTGCIVFTLFSTANSDYQSPYRDKIVSATNTWFSKLDFSLQFDQGMASVLLISTFSLTVLLVLDSFFRTKNEIHLG